MDKKTRKANETLKKANQVIKERKARPSNPVRKSAESEAKVEAFEKASYREPHFFYAILTRNVMCVSKETSMILKGQLVKVISGSGIFESIFTTDGRKGMIDGICAYKRLTW